MPHTNAINVQDLIDRRATVLDSIDDHINTAREAQRSMTPDEMADHDRLVSEHDLLSDMIARATGQSAGSGRFGVPNINRAASPSATASRSLDELFWATGETVRAGSITAKGTFTPGQLGAANPVEQVVVRSSSNDPGVIAPRLGELPADHREAVRAFQQTVAEMAVFGLMVDTKATSSAEGFQIARAHPAMRDRWRHVLRAMDVDTSTEGATWVPTGIGASVHEKVRAAGKVAPLFMRIDLPSNPWKWPIEGGDVTAYRVAEPTSDTAAKMTASTPGTVAATFDAEIFGARTLFSRSVEADSAVVLAPFVIGKLARAFVDGEEKAILDGDSDGTHQDTDVQAIGSTDTRTAWDGLRKKALAQTSTDINAALDAADIRTMRALMGKWGINPDDLALIVSVSSYYDLLGDSDLLTVDKLGPQATLLNGQLGSIYGVPVIVSEHVRENLNASGVHDGITETKSYSLLVNRAEFAIGQRMALDIAVDDSIYRETFQRVAVAFQREDFQHIGAAATDDNVAIGYNVTP